MSRPVAKAMIETGLLDHDALAQLQRWGYLLDCELDEEVDTTVSATDIAEEILEAIESGEAVEMRSTDLDIIHQYLASRERAKLHILKDDGSNKTVGLSVEYCLTKLGEYVIPWTSDPIHEQLLDPSTYLKPVGKDRVYFIDVRELFYDDRKAFIVCTPAKTRDSHGTT